MKTRAHAMVVLFLISLFLTPAQAARAATQTTYDKEQVKKDYRAFLQQLKSLNAQYKEITGEISQVVKEEGVPGWDMGQTANLLPQEDKKEPVQDLGGGAYLKESAEEMRLTVDLPGFGKDAIKLSFQDSSKLLIQAQRQTEGINRSFERTFTLPSPGDQKRTSAAYQDGVLTVRIPKIASKEVLIPVK